MPGSKKFKDHTNDTRANATAVSDEHLKETGHPLSDNFILRG